MMRTPTRLGTTADPGPRSDAASSRVLLVIPAYNEESCIGATLQDVRRACPGMDAVVVDDGSVDDTAAIATSLGFPVVSLPFNVGIGGAVQTGFRYAVELDYDVVVQVDADGQHPPEELGHLVAPVLAGECDVAVGSRFLEEDGYHQTWGRAIGIAILARLTSLLTRQNVTDPTSGFRAYTRSAVRFLAEDYPYDYPEPEALVTLSRAGFRVRDVPVRMLPRRNGVSSIGRAVAARYMSKVLLAITLSVLRPQRAAPMAVRQPR